MSPAGQNTFCDVLPRTTVEAHLDFVEHLRCMAVGLKE